MNASISSLPASPAAPPGPRNARKIAIVGTASSSDKLAPFQDPSWEIWGLAWCNYPRCDRFYEIHRRELWSNVPQTSDHAKYIAAMNALAKPVKVIEPIDGLELQVRYPLIEASRLLIPDFDPAKHKTPFASSIAFMIAEAILEGPAEIGVWGVDMLCEDEYAYQRANCDAWLGFARGCGFKVTVPAECALMKWNTAYGLELPPLAKVAGLSADYIKKRKTSFEAQIRQKQREIHHLEGAVLELGNVLTYADQHARGGVVPGYDK